MICAFVRLVEETTAIYKLFGEIAALKGNTRVDEHVFLSKHGKLTVKL